MAQLICRDLALGYDGGAILEHLNFEVNAGEYLCILGRSEGVKKLYRTVPIRYQM